MRDEDQRASVFRQCRIERLDGFHVEVIGWFIHQQHIRLRQDQLAKQHPPLFATGQHLDRFLAIIAGEKQSPQRAAHDLLVITGARPAAHPVHQRFIPAEFL